MERLLLLWDDIDDLVGIGRHFAAAIALKMGATPVTVRSAATVLFSGALLLHGTGGLR